jgi:hypothetical protein
MDYAVDLDPMHKVLRVTVMRTVVNDEASREIYRTVARIAAAGGPYALILDLSQVVDYPVSSDCIRELAASGPAVPGGRSEVIAASRPVVYGVARMAELLRDSMGWQQLEVVQSMDEAYELLEVSPQDFTQRLFPETIAA